MDLNMEGIIWGLEELSDRSEQERLWAGVGNDGSEISSFVEAVCCTFNDTGLSNLIEKGSASERIPPAQIAPFVVKRVGLTQARRLALFGARIQGHEAKQLGIVHDCFESNDEIESALETALAGLLEALCGAPIGLHLGHV